MLTFLVLLSVILSHWHHIRIWRHVLRRRGARRPIHWRHLLRGRILCMTHHRWHHTGRHSRVTCCKSWRIFDIFCSQKSKRFRTLPDIGLGIGAMGLWDMLGWGGTMFGWGATILGCIGGPPIGGNPGYIGWLCRGECLVWIGLRLGESPRIFWMTGAGPRGRPKIIENTKKK